MVVGRFGENLKETGGNGGEVRRGGGGMEGGGRAARVHMPGRKKNMSDAHEMTMSSNHVMYEMRGSRLEKLPLAHLEGISLSRSS